MQSHVMSYVQSHVMSNVQSNVLSHVMSYVLSHAESHLPLWYNSMRETLPERIAKENRDFAQGGDPMEELWLWVKW